MIAILGSWECAACSSFPNLPHEVEGGRGQHERDAVQRRRPGRPRHQRPQEGHREAQRGVVGGLDEGVHRAEVAGQDVAQGLEWRIR